MNRLAERMALHIAYMLVRKAYNQASLTWTRNHRAASALSRPAGAHRAELLVHARYNGLAPNTKRPACVAAGPAVHLAADRGCRVATSASSMANTSSTAPKGSCAQVCGRDGLQLSLERPVGSASVGDAELWGTGRFQFSVHPTLPVATTWSGLLKAALGRCAPPTFDGLTLTDEDWFMARVCFRDQQHFHSH